ncbi:MAG: S-layer homology domain-containing protein, partial [Ruminococcaceae bacterium]|nr:S-layer homology domain-containing protein [Oscillospiraceae bacterium]
IEVYFVCNETGRRISDFNGGEAVLKVPFEIPAGKVAKGFSVWYVDDFGRKTKHETWHENGHIHWKTGHFSDYVIIYDAVDANGPSFIDAIETPVAPVEPEVPSYAGSMIRFNDVMPYNSAYDAINFVADRGIMNGTGAAQFSPDADLTRAMMATILWRMEGQPTAWYNGQFSDVKGGQWYSSAIAWANAAGIVEGYGNGVFGLNDSLTHGQLCAMLYRWNTRSYGDIGTAWNWAQANGLYADLAGINADEAATRAEIAEVLMAFVLRVW